MEDPETPKTKTIVVTATRLYRARERMTFEIEVPNFAMGEKTLQRICEDYVRVGAAGHFQDHFWEHDDNFATESIGPISFEIEDEAAQ